jgi:hypothetical protein
VIPAPAIASPMSACQFRTTTAASLSSRPFPKTLSQKSDIKGRSSSSTEYYDLSDRPLDQPQLVAAVGQREAAGMSKHVRMHGRQAGTSGRLVVLERIAQKVLATLMGIAGGVAFDVHPASRLLAHARMETPIAHR